MYVTVYHSAEDAWLRTQTVNNLWLLEVNVPQNLGLHTRPLISLAAGHNSWPLIGGQPPLNDSLLWPRLLVPHQEVFISAILTLTPRLPAGLGARLLRLLKLRNNKLEKHISVKLCIVKQLTLLWLSMASPLYVSLISLLELGCQLKV